MTVNDDNIIFGYSADQAIEDGVLVHPYPQRWPNLLITQKIHATCSEQQGRTYDQALVPLLMDCIMAVQSKKNPDFPIVLKHTVADEVWVMPNELGGMTVMNPEDY
jgi:hypothetical protein